VFHGLVVKNPAFVPHVQDGAKEWAVQMRRLDDDHAPRLEREAQD
jgi:hypothetical protein